MTKSVCNEKLALSQTVSRKPVWPPVSNEKCCDKKWASDKIPPLHIESGHDLNKAREYCMWLGYSLTTLLPIQKLISCCWWHIWYLIVKSLTELMITNTLSPNDIIEIYSKQIYQIIWHLILVNYKLVTFMLLVKHWKCIHRMIPLFKVKRLLAPSLNYFS